MNSKMLSTIDFIFFFLNFFLKIIISNVIEFVFHTKYIIKYLYLFFEKNSSKKLIYTHRYYKNYIKNNKIFFLFYLYTYHLQK